jgi:D-alanyl-D-alanine carboxypeptidase (penicillin-binding protein 5/6)
VSKYDIDYGYRKDRPRVLFFLTMHLGLLLFIGAFIWNRLPKPAQSSTDHVAAASLNGPSVKLAQPLPWVSYGQSAYGVVGSGVLATSNEQNQPVPTASLAKVITALTIIRDKPLKIGEQGPLITLTQKDVDIFGEYLRKDGAVVGVIDGESISQYQAFQAMLMPSANNIADSLAIWAFGSLDAYSAHANTYLKELGLNKTVVGTDASGFSSTTRSTADDMVRLGILYMQNPVLRDIATQTQAKIPHAGEIANYNSLINKDGLVGIKVGDTNEAGRCFILANVRKLGGTEIISVSATMGAPSIATAMKDTRSIIRAGDSAYDQTITKQP